jgi:hypothetical protein
MQESNYADIRRDIGAGINAAERKKSEKRICHEFVSCLGVGKN